MQLPPAVSALPRGPLRRGDASARSDRARPPRRVPLPARALADGHLGAVVVAAAADRDDRVALPCRRTLGRRCFPRRAGSPCSRARRSSSRPASQHSSACASGGPAARSAATGLYLVGGFLVVLGVFNGLRGPVRPKGATTTTSRSAESSASASSRWDPGRKCGRARGRAGDDLAVPRAGDRDDRRRRHPRSANGAAVATVPANRSVCSSSKPA